MELDTATVDDLYCHLQANPAVRVELFKRFELDPWRPSNEKLVEVLRAVRQLRTAGEAATQRAVAEHLKRKSGGSISMALAALVKSGLLIAPPRGPAGGGYVPVDGD